MKANREELLKRRVVSKFLAAAETGVIEYPKDQNDDPLVFDAMNIVGVNAAIERVLVATGFKANLMPNWDEEHQDPEKRLKRTWVGKRGEVEVSVLGPSVIMVQGESIIRLLEALVKAANPQAKKKVSA